MEKFTAWMEKHFVPIAAKIGSQKHRYHANYHGRCCRYIIKRILP